MAGMICYNEELELKFAADNVDIGKFQEFCLGRKPERTKSITGPDTYYEQGDNIVRHRIHSEGSHELTVKRRTSTSSIWNRLEIDLFFDGNKTKPQHVEAFLVASGFTKVFKLIKTAHIYWFKASMFHEESVVIYDVFMEGPDGNINVNGRRRFVEVEVEKGSMCDANFARNMLKLWALRLKQDFGVGDPVNESLYEIYSGKRYQLVEPVMKKRKKKKAK